MPQSPTLEMIVGLDRWNICANKPKPERQGPCFLGFDVGGAVSMCAAVSHWPDTGRLDAWAGYGDTPTLADRGEADGVGVRYAQMHERGELRT